MQHFRSLKWNFCACVRVCCFCLSFPQQFIQIWLFWGASKVVSNKPFGNWWILKITVDFCSFAWFWVDCLKFLFFLSIGRFWPYFHKFVWFGVGFEWFCVFSIDFRIFVSFSIIFCVFMPIHVTLKYFLQFCVFLPILIILRRFMPPAPLFVLFVKIWCKTNRIC